MSVVVLDDRDPAIQYTGMWNNGGNSDAEYQATTKWSSPAPNTFATLTFIGTGVTVLGSIAPNVVQMSSFSIDGGTTTTYTSTNASDTRYSQPFFTLGGGSLPFGVNHTLVMTPLRENFFIDLITVNVPSVFAPSSSSSTSIPATSTATTTPTATCPPREGTPIGPILGGVLGGLALVCATLVFVLVYMRHRKIVEKKDIPASSPGVYTPFNPNPGPGPDADLPPTSMSQIVRPASPYSSATSSSRPQAPSSEPYTPSTNTDISGSGRRESEGMVVAHSKFNPQRRISPPPQYISGAIIE